MISVVMPAYNAEGFIREAIASIQNQTYRDFELIVVDDGSTDGTRGIAEALAAADPRLKIIRGEHRGISAALNLGISKAAGDWIAIAHADDVSRPERLQVQTEAAKSQPEAVAWSAYMHHMDAHGRLLGISRPGPTTVEAFRQLRRDAKDLLVAHPAAFLNKEAVLKAGGYDSNFDGSEELELFDRMAAFGPILAIPQPLVLYRIHESSVSMQRFMKMRSFTRYVRARQRARLAKRPLPSYEDFLATYQKQPRLSRWRRTLDDLSQLHYRKAGLAYSERHWLKLPLHFGLAVILNPAYPFKRIYNQLLSKQARTLLHPGEAKPNAPQ